ncbi:cytochrome P450 [Amycolatopsis vancoresmycina]|uniref:Cytochrome P450 n=1 Tax=Amycolatopsis vancoresmycina DSM 44592 TaxID=1292037 RepID=R1G987_9PSEU|nr:cytochrome P450 [Amycolatopsis vancoresmycina]EOD67947.1 cytochrome P450 [Amycolatopsis vancoresmycina DSM 44592]
MTITDPDTYVQGVPYDELARLRRAGPVVRVDDFWAVLGHAEVRRVLRDPGVFSSQLGGTQIRDAADLAYVRRMMLNMDPPEHGRLRGLLTKAFTPRAIAKLTSQIESWARELVLAVADRGECDFAQVAADLPLRTLAGVFGVPDEDRRLMYDWSNRVIGYQDPEYAVSSTVSVSEVSELARVALAVRPSPGPDGSMPDPRTRAGMPDLYAYANALGEYKREHPGDDVMSNLMQHVGDDGGRVSLAEFENLFWLFSVAGNETLRNGLPGGLLALLSHPAEYRRLLDDRSLLPSAVEEMLRWWTPVVHFRRTAASGVRLSDVDIAAGDKVVVWFSSANRDPSVFPDPDTFDIGRTPNDHLTFGHGPHFCLGAHLARVQLRAMFDAVLDLLGFVELAGEPVRLRSNFQNGLKSLPIRWSG